jgi:hypothetical protein
MSLLKLCGIRTGAPLWGCPDPLRHRGGAFHRSYANRFERPYAEAFAIPVAPSDLVHFVELPQSLKGRAFIKVESVKESARLENARWVGKAYADQDVRVLTYFPNIIAYKGWL